VTTTYRKSPGAPGGARQSSLALIVVALLFLGPPAIAAGVAAIWFISGKRDEHWWTYAERAWGIVACSLIATVVLIGNPLTLTFGGYMHWWDHPSLSVDAFITACVPAIPIGAPLGLLLGALFIGAAESTTIGAEWHPLEQRRRAVVSYLARRRAMAAHADLAAQQQRATPPLGAWMDGDLETWQDGPYVCVPENLAPLGLAVVGAPGAGKTETIFRLAQRLMADPGRRIYFLDCKGTDTSLPVRLAGLSNVGRSLVFPHEPINGWTGDADAVFERLYGTQEVGEPFYEAVLQMHLRLASEAFAAGERRDSVELMRMLTVDALIKTLTNPASVEAARELRRERAGTLGTFIRMTALLRAVKGGFDGEASYGDVTTLYAGLPWRSHTDTVAVLKFLLADFAHWCSDPERKERVGQPVTLIIDEISAVPELVPTIIELAERGRDVGVQVIVSAQSWEGLGADDDQRSRLLSALAGGLILHRCDNPEPFCERAGAVRVPELSHQLDETTHSGMGSMRMAFHMRTNPDDVRAAEVGEAWVISNGRHAHGLVIRSESDMELGQRSVSASIERGRKAGDEQGTPGQTTEATPTRGATDEPPEWLGDL
jgi:hypothetical protein